MGNKVTPEQELKDRCTPGIIKKMCELADMGKYYEAFGEDIIYGLTCHGFIFPLLIHRAFTGASKKYISEFIIGIDHEEEEVYEITKALILLKVFKFENYQPSSLTPCECACLHCLIEIFKEERE